MTAEVFNKLLESRLKQIVECLDIKANEYATNDRLHNFKDMADGTKQPTPDMIREKIGDAINYLILMEAILVENMEITNVKG